MITNGGDDPNQLLETLFFYLRHRYLSATECLLFLYLHAIADREGFGYVTPENLATRLGRSHRRCRGYLKRLERHGLLSAARPGSSHGSGFQLEMAVADTGEGEYRPAYGNPPHTPDIPC